MVHSKAADRNEVQNASSLSPPDPQDVNILKSTGILQSDFHTKRWNQIGENTSSFQMNIQQLAPFWKEFALNSINL